MNGTLPSGDRGYRGGDSVWQSGSPWTVFGTVGLVCGITHSPQRVTPPGGNPAARNGQDGRESGPNRIGALRIFAFGRHDRQSHLLAHGPGQEAADRMSLPARGLHQLRKGGAVRPFQQIEDLGGLASVPRRTLLLGGFGRLLCRAGLLGRLRLLGRNVGACWGNAGLLAGFRLLCAGERSRLEVRSQTGGGYCSFTNPAQRGRRCPRGWDWYQCPLKVDEGTGVRGAYREARRAAFGQSVARLQQASSAAVSTLLKVMIDPNTPASTKVRAADSVLDHSAKAIEIEDIDARLTELERTAETTKGQRR